MWTPCNYGGWLLYPLITVLWHGKWELKFHPIRIALTLKMACKDLLPVTPFVTGWSAAAEWEYSSHAFPPFPVEGWGQLPPCKFPHTFTFHISHFTLPVDTRMVGLDYANSNWLLILGHRRHRLHHGEETRPSAKRHGREINVPFSQSYVADTRSGTDGFSYAPFVSGKTGEIWRKTISVRLW